MLYFKLKFLLYTFYVFVLNFNFALSEIITTTLVAGTILGGWFGWESIKSNTVCRYIECCNDRYVPYNLNSKFKLL